MDVARGADHNENIAAIDLVHNAIHLQRILSKPNDIGPDPRAAGTIGDLGCGFIDILIREGSFAAIRLATRGKQFAMHMNNIA
jgi:hypothetical protein